MGQTEAPLTIRPFLPRMTESELMTVMTAGMAHISGGIMAVHPLWHRGTTPVDGSDHDGARHIDDGEDLRAGNTTAGDGGNSATRGERTDVNVIDAIGRGTEKASTSR